MCHPLPGPAQPHHFYKTESRLFYLSLSVKTGQQENLGGMKVGTHPVQSKGPGDLRGRLFLFSWKSMILNTLGKSFLLIFRVIFLINTGSSN